MTAKYTTILVLAIVVHLNALKLKTLDVEGIDSVMRLKQPSLVIFTDSSVASTVARSVIEGLDEKSGLRFFESKEGEEQFELARQYMGLNWRTLPQVIINHEPMRYRYTANQFTAQQLTKYIDAFLAGSLPRFYKTAPRPVFSRPVAQLNGQYFSSSQFLKSRKEFFVKIYVPWCGHCKALAPHFEAAAQRISHNPNIIFAEVNYKFNEIASLAIETYPRMFFFFADKNRKPVEFTSQRSMNGMLQWIMYESDYEWFKPRDIDLDGDM